MIIKVSNTESLLSALNTVKAGDTIQLAPGVYSSFAIKNKIFSGEVTITSQDPGNPAILTGAKIWSSSNITFSNLELRVDPNGADNPYQVVAGSSNIHFDKLDVHGSLNDNPQDDRSAFLVRDSHDVSITNSEFHELRHGIGHLDMDGLVISDNTFKAMRSDGVKGGNSSNVLITRNQFSDFSPVAGDHPDAIQFWTEKDGQLTRNITVTDNVIMRGGGDAFQGIFIRDEGDKGYENVTISNNLVVGSMTNGIAVSGVRAGLRVEGNTVSALHDSVAWIRVYDTADGIVQNNAATKYLMSGNTTLVDASNQVLTAATDGGKALLAAWAQSNLSFAKVAAFSVDPTLAAVNQIAATLQQTVVKQGTDGADRLSVDAARNTVIDGGAGNDVLTGGGIGHNTLKGGEGDDIYYVRSQFDTVVELDGEGYDFVNAYVDFTLPDNVEKLRLMGDATFGEGNDLDNMITSTDADDTLLGHGGDDNLQGAGGNDTISGGSGNDSILGGTGDDKVMGGTGDDKLYGQAGNDTLIGGAGNDHLEGGTGADWMTGGAGADFFFFREGDLSTTPDVITDFNRDDGDIISLSMIDANTLTAGNGKFTFIGTEAFHKKAGELRYEAGPDGLYVYGDVNGDGVADIAIIVVGQSTLKATDFVL